MFFVSGLGMILYVNGQSIRVADDNDINDDVPGWFALEFAGAFLAILFWVSAALRAGRLICIKYKHYNYSLQCVDECVLYIMILSDSGHGSLVLLRHRGDFQEGLNVLQSISPGHISPPSSYSF